MNLTSKELLTTFQNWLQENKLSDKYCSYFIEQNLCLVFQVWDLEKMISDNSIILKI